MKKNMRTKGHDFEKSNICAICGKKKRMRHYYYSQGDFITLFYKQTHEAPRD